MKNDCRTELVIRETILRLLSDDEVASVSSIEGTAHLLDGEEYLDLENLDQGVRSALGTGTAPMGRVLARRAVHAESWTRILQRLAALHPTKPPAEA